MYRARVETSRGAFVMEVQRALAPLGADRFYNLIRAGYYDDSRFTRVVPGFIVQFGIARDSALNAMWSARSFPDDSVKTSNTRGTFGFAMTGPNARTTQIYISLVDNTRLDAQGFSPLGRVVEGMSVVDSLYGGYGEDVRWRRARRQTGPAAERRQRLRRSRISEAGPVDSDHGGSVDRWTGGPTSLMLMAAAVA